MANTKPGPLPLPSYGGAPASAKPLTPTPLIEAGKRFMPQPPKLRKKKLAFSRGMTAFNKGPRAFG